MVTIKNPDFVSDQMQFCEWKRTANVFDVLGGF